MIPKTIHYCWFGGGQKSKLLQKCIKSWKKVCPDYHIIEWNEDNFDLSTTPEYIRSAYNAKKWAFVSDYARLKIVFENGGIYMDTDVELLKPLDALLGYAGYFGFETPETVNTGLGFAAEKGLPMLMEMMQQYENRDFNYESGQYLTCPLIDTGVLVKHGLQLDGAKQLLDNNVLVLSAEYLCPKSLLTEWISKTENTFSIHHFTTSWFSEEGRKHHKKTVRQARLSVIRTQILSIPNRIARFVLGRKFYEKIKMLAKGNKAGR